jgi:hypothetical protein
MMPSSDVKDLLIPFIIKMAVAETDDCLWKAL